MVDNLHLVSPKQAAEIVKLKEDGTINGPNQKKLLDYVIEANLEEANARLECQGVRLVLKEKR